MHDIDWVTVNQYDVLPANEHVAYEQYACQTNILLHTDRQQEEFTHKYILRTSW